MTKETGTNSKYLVTIEFRYRELSKQESAGDYVSKTLTIGVYDTFEDACINGNKTLENLEGRFSTHVFPDGRTAKKDRFSKNGGCFGRSVNIVTNLAYLKTPFEFYAKITTLNYAPFNETIDEVMNSINKYKNAR